MQGSLINYWASEDGFSIVHQSDGQPIKPLRPFTVKMPLDDDLVDLLSNVFAFHSCAPCSPSCSLTAKGTAYSQPVGTDSRGTGSGRWVRTKRSRNRGVSQAANGIIHRPPVNRNKAAATASQR